MRASALLQRLLKYGGVNLVLLPINIGTAWVLTELGVNYLVATAAGYAAHTTLMFFPNRRWTFQAVGVRMGKGISTSILVHAVSFAIILGITVVTVEYFGWGFLPARIFASVATGVCWDFPADSWLTFRQKLFRK